MHGPVARTPQRIGAGVVQIPSAIPSPGIRVAKPMARIDDRCAAERARAPREGAARPRPRA
jgi:hypothetical protein